MCQYWCQLICTESKHALIWIVWHCRYEPSLFCGRTFFWLEKFHVNFPMVMWMVPLGLQPSPMQRLVFQGHHCLTTCLECLAISHHESLDLFAVIKKKKKKKIGSDRPWHCFAPPLCVTPRWFVTSQEWPSTHPPATVSLYFRDVQSCFRRNKSHCFSGRCFFCLGHEVCRIARLACHDCGKWTPTQGRTAEVEHPGGAVVIS